MKLYFHKYVCAKLIININILYSIINNNNNNLLIFHNLNSINNDSNTNINFMLRFLRKIRLFVTAKWHG